MGTGPTGHAGPGPEVCVQQCLGEISGVVRLILIIRRCVREQDLYPSEDWWLIQSWKPLSPTIPKKLQKIQNYNDFD